ncbi:hypothetical protein FACS1894137_17900 [Spirochaetia bacterium]|nr:hypothetical protein FACS1894137_17900 [Spirochaetia bacterium]
MGVPRVYIETTVFNILYEPDLPQYVQNKADSQRFFDLLKTGRFDPYTSVYVIRELENNPNQENRDKMLRMVNEYQVKAIPESDEAERLTAVYLADKVVSPAWPTDALNVAMTTVNGLDFIVSLNFTHIVREWTIKKVRVINAREGYRQIGIYRPSEVLEL